jgi:hypothetical protein
MKEIMKAETWYTAKEAKEKGFINTILETGKATKAQFDLTMYANVPDVFEWEPPEATERQKEKALRDVGFSLNDAKAILAGRRDGNQRDVENLKRSILEVQNKIKR